MLTILSLNKLETVSKLVDCCIVPGCVLLSLPLLIALESSLVHVSVLTD